MTSMRTPPARAHPLHGGEHHGHDERATRNRAVRVHLDYSFNANWGVSFELPILSRKHHHIDLEDGANKNWDFDKLGDARLIGRYAFTGNPNATWGLSFGAKLPSGDFKQRNDQGAVAERSLQPGSGTTDTILGAFYQRSREGAAWSWFGQLALQRALNDRDQFKPGRQVTADVGLSYRFNNVLSALLQLNLQHRARDRGQNAEPNDSGGKFAFLSPGLQARLGGNTLAYAFLQLPLYQYVNGTQLSVDKALLFGVSHNF